jgi:thioredoxin 1
MRDLLLDIINHRSAITASAILVGIMTLAFVRDGIGVVDVLILVGMVITSYVVWRLRVTSPTVNIDSVQALRSTVRNGGRPTLVQLYSRYCGGCLAVKPMVDQLEAEAGERLQVIRLDIDQEPGKSLLKEYGVLFTPTFLYFDRNGNKVRESTLVLDRPRIMYDLEKA